jgi:error-prone DNA polymerase
VFVELCCRSNFSFLDGASDPEALVERAVQLGMPALAIADRDGLYGAVRFATAAKRAGLKAILGADLTMEDGESLALLIENLQGYRNLCHLISRSRLGNPKDEPSLRYAELDGYTGGLIAVATATSSNVQRPRSKGDGALPSLDLGPWTLDSFFVKTWRHLRPEDGPRNAGARRVAAEREVRCVATNLVRYATPDRAMLHDVVTSVRLRLTLEQAGLHLAPNHERYLKGADEMARLFRDHPEELAASVEIAERCTFDLADLRYEFPRPDNIPEGADPYQVLVSEVWRGALCFYPEVTPKLQDRIVHELDIVRQLDLPGYLLVFKDIVDFCAREGILCSIRGSAPASVLLYCLGLCPIDPLEHGLLFERFASPERGEYPDIDLDIAHEDRERVIQYVYEKYGRERAAMVCEVNTYRPKSAIRDVGFALGLPTHQVDQLAKVVDMWDSQSLTDLLGDPRASIGHIAGPLAERLIALCRQLLGAPRHLSIHVGGMVISARPLDEVTHREPARMINRTIIPWDKDDITNLAEEFGVNLIKLDLLGLGMLAAVSRCFHFVREQGGPELRLHGFRYDPRVFDMICAADTVGLFQIESRAQMSYLPRLQPRDLHDVALSVGAIRPGPGAMGAGNHIALRRMGREPITYPHPELVGVLEQTKGVLLWQEQVMQVVMIMAGYTPGEAEQFRRAMTHKRSVEHMTTLCEDLERRIQARGHSAALAEEIRKTVVGFAGYGFPRAHAYPFAHLALVSATLKLNYPAAFCAALLNCQPMGFYAPHTLIWDAHRHGVQILPVDVNASGWECGIETGSKVQGPRSNDSYRPYWRSPHAEARRRGVDVEPFEPLEPLEPVEGVGPWTLDLGPPVALRLGFNMVSGLGSRAREVLERERERGPYVSLADFVHRTGFERDVVERLAEVGALLRFDERRAVLWQAGELAGLGGPNRLPGLAEQVAEPASLPPMDAWTATQADYTGLGLSPDHHLLQFYRAGLRRAGVLSAIELERVRNGRTVKVGGLVICRQRPETAKEFFFITLEDETGLVNIIVRPDVYRADRSVFRGEPLLVVEGRLQREDGVTHIMASGGRPLGHDRAAAAVRRHDFR